MAKAKKNNANIWFEQLGNDGKPTGHKQQFSAKVAERLLRLKDAKWRLIEQEKPKEPRVEKVVITEDDRKNFRHQVEKMPKQTPQLIEWVNRQKNVKLLELAKESIQSQVVLSAITDRLKELTNTIK